MSAFKKLMMTTAAGESGLPEGVSFDGTNDYLRNSYAATGRFYITHSFWFYAASGTQTIYSRVMTNGNDHIRVQQNGNYLAISFFNSNGGQQSAGTKTLSVALNTWNHLIYSGSFTSSGNAIQFYLNDVDQGDLILSNDALANTEVEYVARIGGARGKIRCAHMYIKDGVIDLDVEANRRNFITADLKPAAGQGSYSAPRTYLPMLDAATAGVNEGSQGNWSVIGVLGDAQRGPNQYNAAYSDFTGTADYLSREIAPTGIADGKQFTISFNAFADVQGTTRIVAFGSVQNVRFQIVRQSDRKLVLSAIGPDTVGVLSATVNSPLIEEGRNYHVIFSVDLSSTGSRHCYINGVAASVTWSQYVNDPINFNITSTPRYRVGAAITTTVSDFWDGRLGPFYFDTSYISLPANLEKFVTGTGIDAKPVDLGANGELPTGTAPIIYLPMYGNNAGKNYGTGGDFTVNSGPYTGARGPNEYWGNNADFDGTTGYLSRATALGLSDGKTFSMSFWYNPQSSSASNYVYYTDTSGGSARFYVLRNTSNNLNIVGKNSAGANVLNATLNTAAFSSTGTARFVQICIDLTSTSLRKIYVDGQNQTNITWTTYTNDNFNWDVQNTKISTASNGLNGTLSEFYFTTDYIDFTQEANRLKFRDAFGNPVNLTQQIEDAAIPNPAIYMRFPPTAFGTNYGTGGDFTVNGTITDGGQL